MQYITFLAVCFLLTFTSNAYANNSLGLEIEALFNKIEELYNQEQPDIKKIHSLKAYYTSEDFRFTQEFASNLGKKILHTDQNREEFLESLKDTSNKLSNSSISHTITDIRYLDDSNSAEVDYTALFKGDITTKKEGVWMVFIKFKSLAICTELVRIEDQHIKSFGSDCKTEIIYGEPQPIK